MTTTGRSFVKTVLANDRGLALAIVLMMMAILLAVTGAGLFHSGLSLKATANLKGGTAALQAADAGIQHALAKIPAGGDFDSFWAGTGLANFPCKNSSGSTGTCNGTTYKPTLTGSINGYTYTVEVTNDTTVGGETATSDANKIVILTSTATGSGGSTRKVRAYIGRSPWLPPGAIYFPGAPANLSETFNGNSFAVSGNDTNPWQAVGSGSASPILGIATTDSGTTTEVNSTLGSSRYGQVTGLGSNPSVAVSTTLNVDQLATDLLNLGVEGTDKKTLSGSSYDTSDLGTSSSNPKIVHLTNSSVSVRCGSGNHPTAVGYGVLIVDGNLTVNGLFRWNGLIIFKGNGAATIRLMGASASEGSTFWGSLLVRQPNPPTSPPTSVGLTMQGKAQVTYSSQAIKTVTDKWPSVFTTNARIIAWHEMMS
jgi:Tfp pilus assembly protein PilX